MVVDGAAGPDVPGLGTVSATVYGTRGAITPNFGVTEQTCTPTRAPPGLVEITPVEGPPNTASGGCATSSHARDHLRKDS